MRYTEVIKSHRSRGHFEWWQGVKMTPSGILVLRDLHLGGGSSSCCQVVSFIVTQLSTFLQVLSLKGFALWNLTSFSPSWRSLSFPSNFMRLVRDISHCFNGFLLFNLLQFSKTVSGFVSQWRLSVVISWQFYSCNFVKHSISLHSVPSIFPHPSA